MLLTATNLHKTYQGNGSAVRALDDISMTVDAGEFVAVQGPSGCGKSTLLLVMGGLLAPDSGDVCIADEHPYALQPDKRAQFRAETIGFVFQQFHLVPYLSVLDNIVAPAIATKLTNPAERAREMIHRFGLEHRINHVPGKLSTGERQRTALARALLNQPKILLADEPTGNLDRENADAVLGYLTEFTAEGGAVLLVTHDPAAATHAQRIIKIQDGKLSPE